MGSASALGEEEGFGRIGAEIDSALAGPVPVGSTSRGATGVAANCAMGSVAGIAVAVECGGCAASNVGASKDGLS